MCNSNGFMVCTCNVYCAMSQNIIIWYEWSCKTLFVLFLSNLFVNSFNGCCNFIVNSALITVDVKFDSQQFTV